MKDLTRLTWRDLWSEALIFQHNSELKPVVEGQVRALGQVTAWL